MVSTVAVSGRPRISTFRVYDLSRRAGDVGGMACLGVDDPRDALASCAMSSEAAAEKMSSSSSSTSVDCPLIAA